MQKKTIKAASDAGRREELVRDRVWIWAHRAGAHNEYWLRKMTRKSSIEPVDAADYMGIDNIIMVRYEGEPQPPFDRHFGPFRKKKKVIWSLSGIGGVTSEEERCEVLKLAAGESNIVGFVLDDFFCGGAFDVPPDDNDVPIPASLTPQQLAGIHENMVIGGRRLDLSAVLYTRQISPRAVHHLRHVDWIQMWTWSAKKIDEMEENLTRLEKLNLGKKIIVGCYMFDYSILEPMPVELMKTQSELALKWLKAGRIEGIIFLGTPICDLGLEAVEWTREWLAEAGKQELK